MSTVRTGGSEPPEAVFWAPGVGPKQLYTALKGVKSALKTSWMARNRAWNRDHGYPAAPFRVWRGDVAWTEIDPETGSPIMDPITDGATAIHHLMAPLKGQGHGFESGIPIPTVESDQRFLDFHDHDHVDARNRYQFVKVLTHVHRGEQ